VCPGKRAPSQSNSTALSSAWHATPRARRSAAPARSAGPARRSQLLPCLCRQASEQGAKVLVARLGNTLVSSAAECRRCHRHLRTRSIFARWINSLQVLRVRARIQQQQPTAVYAAPGWGRCYACMEWCGARRLCTDNTCVADSARRSMENGLHDGYFLFGPHWHLPPNWVGQILRLGYCSREGLKVVLLAYDCWMLFCLDCKSDQKRLCTCVRLAQ